MSSPIIGGLNEKSLHRQLKEYYRTTDSKIEQVVSGYVVDVVSSNELIEIQTANFSAMRNKLAVLLTEHRVRLVYPVAAETTISVFEEDGILRSSRKSPKKGCLSSAAGELLYLAELLPHPNLTVEVLLVKQEEVRRADGKGSWRRRGVSIEDRMLCEVLQSRLFAETSDYLALLPVSLPSIFGNREIAGKLTGMNKRGKLRLAGQITYLLRKLGLIEITDKEGNRLLFTAC